MHSETVLKIPDNCFIVGKTFEISKNLDELDISDTVKIKIPENIVTKRIEPRHKNSPSTEQNKLPNLSNEFEINNNATKENLNNISFRPLSSTETMLFATSGSLMSFLICLILILGIVFCIKNSRRAGSPHPHTVHIDLEKGIKRDDLTESLTQNLRNLDSAEIPSENSDSTRTVNDDKDKFFRENELKKPPFQQKLGTKM